MTGTDAIVVFDSEALSRAINGDAYMRGVIKDSYDNDELVIVPATTIVEATHAKSNRAALDWLLSRVEVKPVTEKVAVTASRLLIAARLHGHKHALDAILCAIAIQNSTGRPLVYTSDPDDIKLISDDQVDIVALR